LQIDVERPVTPGRKMRQRRRLLRWGLDTAVLEQSEGRHPRRDRRLERLPEQRAERHVLPRLNVACAPVVDEHDAEDVVREALCRYGLAERAWHSNDEAELELDVEPP